MLLQPSSFHKAGIWLAAFICALSASNVAHSAVLCVTNKGTGQFEAANKRTAPEGACDGEAHEDQLASFYDAASAAQGLGTKVIGGVVVTNRANVGELMPAPTKPAPPKEPDTWEILESDVTLQKTLERWAALVGWQVQWDGAPEIRNPGYVKLTGRNFIAAADYVLSKAKVAASSAGISLRAIAYPNRVLVISKEGER